MDTFLHGLQYIPAHLSGDGGLLQLTWQHVYMSLLATGIAVVVAMPLGLYVGHTGRGEIVAVSIANQGRALPAFGILALVYVPTINLPGFGFYPTLITLVLLAIPPILTNTYVGVKGVDADTVEAARGMGMSGREVLLRIELPLALPVIVAGVRTSAVAVVATATLASLFGWGGLGQPIFYGYSQNDYPMVVAGAVMVALLAIAFEVGLGAVQRAVSPRLSSARSRWSFRGASGKEVATTA